MPRVGTSTISGLMNGERCDSEVADSLIANAPTYENPEKWLITG